MARPSQWPPPWPPQRPLPWPPSAGATKPASTTTASKTMSSLFMVPFLLCAASRSGLDPLQNGLEDIDAPPDHLPLLIVELVDGGGGEPRPPRELLHGQHLGARLRQGREHQELGLQEQALGGGAPQGLDAP